VVKLGPIKTLAAKELGRHSALRLVLLQEKDAIPATDFLAKLPVYLLLLREEVER